MSQHCCNEDQVLESKPGNQVQRKLLFQVLCIHAAMCVITLGGGLYARSTVVMAESVDFLSHVFLIGLSLYATTRGSQWIARASLAKGLTMLGIGISVVIDGLHRLKTGEMPSAEAIGVIGALGFAAHFATLALLNRFRKEDLNVHSSWLCSRNDILTHGGIVVTSILVGITQSRWPDAVIGSFLALMILSSSLHVIRRSLRLMREGQAPLLQIKLKS